MRDFRHPEATQSAGRLITVERNRFTITEHAPSPGIIGKASKTTQHMDTNDLSRETYTAIIDTAERFHHDLTLQFGVLASACKTDNEYLDQSESMIKEWLTDWVLDEVIKNIFFDDKPRK